MKQGPGAKINYSEVHNITIGTCNVFTGHWSNFVSGENVLI